MPNTLKYTDDALIHHLYLTMRAFTKGVNEVMKPLGLYSSEWAVLNFVAKHDSFPQSDIAAALEIEGAAISKTLSTHCWNPWKRTTTRAFRRMWPARPADRPDPLPPEKLPYSDSACLNRRRSPNRRKAPRMPLS